MLRLMLLRHAKSDWSVGGQPDRDRKLNQRGRAAATQMGAYMGAEKLLPTLILCSTAARTRETCNRLIAAFAHPPIHYERQLYEAAPETIIDLIAATSGDVRDLLVIGHNPGLQLAALKLVAAGSAEQRADLRDKFPTAALAVIDFDIDAWSAVKSGKGRLERFTVPRQISQAD
jgi:phosphohistidine phosphatase